MGLLAKGWEECGEQCGAGLGSHLRGMLHFDAEGQSCGQQQGNFLSLLCWSTPDVWGSAVSQNKVILHQSLTSPQPLLQGGFSAASVGAVRAHGFCNREAQWDLSFLCSWPISLKWHETGPQYPREEGWKSPQSLYTWAVRGGTVSKAEEITVKQLLGTCRRTLRPAL